MSLQISEISITYRTTRDITEDTQSITICTRGDRIDVESILPQLTTNAEAVPTASGTPYIKDPGNLTGSFEVTTRKKHATHAAACAAWGTLITAAANIPKSGWLEITADEQTLLFRAGITEVAPALQEYFETVTSWNFVICSPTVNPE